jgi:phosphatidylglycerophosphate synthase
MRCTPLRVALFVPNLVTYARLALLPVLIATAGNLRLCSQVWLLFVALDGVDGWAARALRQSSSFGAFLDVAADNSGRALLWQLASRARADRVTAALACVLPALEWLVFACTQASPDAAWKTSVFARAPAFVSWLVSCGLQSPQGFLIVSGLNLLPLALLLGASRNLLAFLAFGRLLAACAELWVLSRHLRDLLERDALANRRAVD